jgi:hypothetical protein
MREYSMGFSAHEAWLGCSLREGNDFSLGDFLSNCLLARLGFYGEDLRGVSETQKWECLKFCVTDFSLAG